MNLWGSFPLYKTILDIFMNMLAMKVFSMVGALMGARVQKLKLKEQKTEKRQAIKNLVIFLLGTILLLACSPEISIENASTDGDWRHHGGNHNSDKYAWTD